MNGLGQGGWLVITLLAGAVLPLQAGINASLARHVGHPLVAGAISFLVGTLFLVVVVALARLPLPSASSLRGMPLWVWTGGLMGAVWVTISLLAAPRLGAATFVGVVIGSQLVSSLLLDQFGVAGFSERPITLWRVVGIVLIGCGALLVHFAPGGGD